jgi:hypothetical protein
MSDELIEVAAREAYEEALRSEGVYIAGQHSWGNQRGDLKASWRRIVRPIERRLELGLSPPQKSASDQATSG